ncbi:MAG: hypothetical protein ACI927_000291, partial [Oceanospirillaceae bacterium]
DSRYGATVTLNSSQNIAILPKYLAVLYATLCGPNSEVSYESNN